MASKSDWRGDGTARHVGASLLRVNCVTHSLVVEPGVEFGHWDGESCGTAITADGDLREQKEGVVEISPGRSMESQFAAVCAEFGRAAGATSLNYDWANNYDAGVFALGVLFPPLEFVRWKVDVGLAAVGADHHITEGP